MTESNPEITSPEAAGLPAYKDRSTGLMVFGLLTLLLGVLVGLFIPLVLFGQAAAAKASHAPINYAVILPAVSIYGPLSVVLIWLGIGSMLARRWARALLLIGSWIWLVMGIMMLIFMAIFLPKVLGQIPAPSTTGTNSPPALPPGAMLGAMIVVVLFTGFIWIILPAVWVFFYKSPHVKATCEARQSLPSWTDACPLPVLGFCLWLAFCVPMMLLMPLMGKGVIPFFGQFLTGATGSVFYFLIAAAWATGAWRMYRLDARGWWLTLITLGLFFASAMLTYAQHDMVEAYRLMHYPEAQIEQLQKLGLFTGKNLCWVTGASMVPFFGYLLFIKKYFRGRA